MLREMLRILSTYRLYTQSHLKFHLDADPTLRQKLADAHWTRVELWDALGQTALGTQQDAHEIWHEIEPPLRRLLHRHHYRTDAGRIAAHTMARRFYGGWTQDRAAGREQQVVLVECLWHETVPARDRAARRPGPPLARRRGRARPDLRHLPDVKPAEFTGGGLRRLHDDDELKTLLSGYPGLFEDRPPVSPPSEATDDRSGWHLCPSSGGGGRDPPTRSRRCARAGSRASCCTAPAARARRCSCATSPTAGGTCRQQRDWVRSHRRRRLGVLAAVEPGDRGRHALGPRALHAATSRPPPHRPVRPPARQLRDRPRPSSAGSTVLSSTATAPSSQTAKTIVVLTLDTIEAIRSMYLLLTLTQWMKELPHTLFILSGRPPGGHEPDPLREELDRPAPAAAERRGGAARVRRRRGPPLHRGQNGLHASLTRPEQRPAHRR